MALEVASLFAKLGLDKSDFESGLNSARGGIGVLGTAVGVGLGNAATMVGQSVVRAVGDVAGVVTSSIGAAADMEAQLSSIGAVLGKTKDEVQPLSDLIVNLGINPNLKVTATEAADAIEMLARNGLNMTQIMDGAAEATVLLANSTGGSFSVSANIATDSMAIFGIEAKDMMTAVNGITSVTLGSKFSVDDYGLALAQAGGVAASSGVDFADFNTAIAGISPLFASGSDAGTSFKTMLQRLIPASAPAGDAMRELGLLTEDGTNKFFDANGQLKSMAEISGLLQGALGGLSEERRNDALSTIFGTDAMRASVGLMKLGKEGFEALQGQMGQTDAMDSAATRMDNLSGTMEIITGVIDGVKLQVGNALLPTMQMLADKALEFAEEVGPKIPAFMDEAAPKLQAFASWFIDDGVPSIVDFGRNIIDFSTAASEKINSFVEAAKPTLDSWGNWIVTVGIPAVQDFGVKVGEFAATAGQKITEFTANAKPILQDFADKWQTVVGPAIDIVKDSIDRITDALGLNEPKMATANSNMGEFDGILKALKLSLDAVIIAVELLAVTFDFIADVIEYFRDGYDVLVGWNDQINQIKDGIAEIIGSGLSNLGSALNLPGFETGGVIPGPTGSPQLVIAHGGETIVPSHKQNGGGQSGSTFNISINATDSGGGKRAADAFISTLRARGMVTI